MSGKEKIASWRRLSEMCCPLPIYMLLSSEISENSGSVLPQRREEFPGDYSYYVVFLGRLCGW